MSWLELTLEEIIKEYKDGDNNPLTPRRSREIY